MTITSYDTLKSTIADYLNRDDLTDNIPGFIQLAEDNFNRRLKLLAMGQRADAAVTANSDGSFDRYVTLPPDYREARRLIINSNPITMPEVTSLDNLFEKTASATAGAPDYFAVHGFELVLGPVPDQAYSLTLFYYANLTALSDTNPSNWLLLNAPSAYLFGSLVHAESFLQNDARIATWKAGHEEIMEGLEFQAERATYSGSPLNQ